jgi:nitrilase
MMITVAVAQSTPVVLNLQASIEKACDWIARAAKRGAALIAFPETWLPVYPFWCDAGTFGLWDHGPSKKLHARLIRNSIAIPSPETAILCNAARNAGIAVVMGANERDPYGGSLYNALLFIDERGRICGRRRKLVPTFGERLIWGYGDAAGLEAFALAGARVGGMICWEHWMPLPRFVLHASGEQVHVAAWPVCREKYQLASRHYAFEGRCYVLASAMFLMKSDLPSDFELRQDLKKAPDIILAGGSAIIGPDADYLVEPVFGKEELLVADIELDCVEEEKLALDTAGHYHRPDLFNLSVNREPLIPFHESASSGGSSLSARPENAKSTSITSPTPGKS